MIRSSGKNCKSESRILKNSKSCSTPTRTFWSLRGERGHTGLETEEIRPRALRAHATLLISLLKGKSWTLLMIRLTQVPYRLTKSTTSTSSISICSTSRTTLGTNGAVTWSRIKTTSSLWDVHKKSTWEVLLIMWWASKTTRLSTNNWLRPRRRVMTTVKMKMEIKTRKWIQNLKKGASLFPRNRKMEKRRFLN